MTTKRSTPKRLKAAIYARFSTDLQNERSIDDQVALCRSFADQHDLRVVKTYDDRARSGGSILGRDGLAALMEDAKSGHFEVLIVEALDRLSRDMEDLAGLHKRLSFLNIEIRAVHEGTVNSVLVGLRGIVGQLYREDGAKKIRRGQMGRVRDGLNPGGNAYGYEPVLGEPGKFAIVEDEADIIRRIFQEYLSGKTPRNIAAGLNRDGVKAPRGDKWNASTLNGSRQRGNGIIHNELYVGRLVWNRVRMVRDPDTGKRLSRVNPESEWVRQDVPHLAIIDQDVFDKAQSKRKLREGEKWH